MVSPIGASMTSTVRALAVVAALSATSLVAATAAVAAYGPEATPGTYLPPGGFTLVIASRTIGPNGGVLNAKHGPTRLHLRIPAHTMSQRVQFTFTRPRLSGLKNAIPKGMRLHAGFALLANRTDGTPTRGWFSRRRVSIVISNRTLNKKTRVLAWNKARNRFVRVPAASRRGRVVVTTRRSAEFLVISPR